MLEIIKPSNWTGWTAVLIVVVAAVLAGMADGAHKMIRTVGWLIVLVVAAVVCWNSFKGK